MRFRHSQERASRRMLLGFILLGKFFCLSATAAGQLPRGYAGDAACRTCHAEIFANYSKTAHKLSSQTPAIGSILGSFHNHENILKTSNPNLYFRMESRPQGFFETAVSTLSSGTTEHSERIDIVLGSGRVGQTYLYWKGDFLFQLPVSYWTDLAAWVNSPGYRDGEVKFERPVIPRCLECHVSYALPASELASSNQYKPGTMVLGISCERCHGPAQAHAESKAGTGPGGHMIALTKLSRDRQIDVCAQCHGGRRYPQAPAFSYLPGEPLDNYYVPDHSNPAAVADVHGNQVALLQRSRCYQSSANLVCSSCHDVHQEQRSPAAFSAHCLECHKAENCGEFQRRKQEILSRCVDCHMPVETSNLIVSSYSGKQARPSLRSHWIRIYAEPKKQSGKSGEPGAGPGSDQVSGPGA
jgi:hypothetical protein